MSGVRKGPQTPQEARRCAACHATLPEQKRGRPRAYCTECVPPGTGAPAIRAWRAVNRERVEAYNAERRRGPVELTCAECGETFSARRADTLTCSYACKLKRKGRQSWARRRAA